MHGCRNYVKERRNLSLHIVQSMDFYPSFSLAELRPAEDRKAKLNGGGVECIDIPSEIEDVSISLSTSLLHYVTGKFLKYAEVFVPVGLRQIAASNRVSESEELGLSARCFKRNDQVPKAVAPAKLSEHKYF